MTYHDLIVAYANDGRQVRGQALIGAPGGEPLGTRESYAAMVSLTNDRIRTQFIARLQAGQTPEGESNADEREGAGGGVRPTSA